MDIFQLALVLRTRFMLIMKVALLATLVVVAGSLLLPKTYKGTVTLVLNHKSFDPVTGQPTPSQMIPGYVDTQVDLIESRAVALRVATDLQLHKRAALIDELGVKLSGNLNNDYGRIAEKLVKRLDLTPSKESSVMKIAFKSRDPVMAAELANAFSDAYQAIHLQLKTDRLRKATDSFGPQLNTLRDAVETAQTRLAEYRSQNHVLGNGSEVDTETARLNALETELVQVENELIAARSKAQSARSDALNSPAAAADTLVREIKLDLAKAETRLAALDTTLTPANPRHQAAKAEVDNLRRALATAVRTTVDANRNQSGILSMRADELRKAVDAQRERVIRLNHARDQMAVLLQDLDNARHSYEAATQRHAQIRIESGSDQSDISVLSPATPPEKAAYPIVWLNAAIAMLAGLCAGIGLALLLEITSRPVRSVFDVVEELGIPVLGDVRLNGYMPSPRRPMLGAPRRLLLGS